MTTIELPPVLEAGAAARWRELIETLADARRRYPDAALASSLAAEDMVLTHAIFDAGLDLEVFTLDTGRLHAETLGVLDAIRQRYRREVTIYRPDAAAVDAYVAAHGAYAFYESVELRKACCQIRRSSRSSALWPDAAPGSPGSGAPSPPRAESWRAKNRTPRSACTSSTRWRTGARPRSGP